MCEVAERIYDQSIEQGKLEKAKTMALNMHKDGVADELIAKYANVSIKLVKKWIRLQPV